jgi:hypothetical protein
MKYNELFSEKYDQNHQVETKQSPCLTLETKQQEQEQKK